MKNFRLGLTFAMGAIALQTPLAVTAAPLTSTLDQSCWQTLNDVKAQIGEVVDQPNFLTSAFRVSADYPNPPSDRPLGLVLGVGGRQPGMNNPSYWQVRNFMSSPMLQISLATQLMNQCQNVSAVKFGMLATDWGLQYGVVNSKVVPFTPISPPCRNLRWGQYCQP
ncbi:MAG: hypothetical protein HC810_03705 [Acaryochloridaceae cyanobacterium RL_2_7]|nr:hypothetical protein [Acaryochloridaceae cyanobacterium RL_2_7]